jgi:hypothetical protein
MGGAFAEVKRPRREAFQSLFPVPRLRIWVATLLLSNYLHGIYSNSIPVMYLQYLQAIAEKFVLFILSGT